MSRRVFKRHLINALLLDTEDLEKYQAIDGPQPSTSVEKNKFRRSSTSSTFSASTSTSSNEQVQDGLDRSFISRLFPRNLINRQIRGIVLYAETTSPTKNTKSIKRG